MSERMIEMERRVDAPPDRVYRMWSDPETLRSWLCYDVRGSLMPGVSSVLVFPRHEIEVEVLSAEPNSRFSLRWIHPQPDGVRTEVVISIQRSGYGSLVRLSDGPYDIGNEPTLDEYARAIGIWADSLAQLRAYVDYSVDLRKER